MKFFKSSKKKFRALFFWVQKGTTHSIFKNLYRFHIFRKHQSFITNTISHIYTSPCLNFLKGVAECLPGKKKKKKKLSLQLSSSVEMRTRENV